MVPRSVRPARQDAGLRPEGRLRRPEDSIVPQDAAAIDKNKSAGLRPQGWPSRPEDSIVPQDAAAIDRNKPLLGAAAAAPAEEPASSPAWRGVREKTVGERATLVVHDR